MGGHFFIGFLLAQGYRAVNFGWYATCLFAKKGLVDLRESAPYLSANKKPRFLGLGLIIYIHTLCEFPKPNIILT